MKCTSNRKDQCAFSTCCFQLSTGSLHTCKATAYYKLSRTIIIGSYNYLAQFIADVAANVFYLLILEAQYRGHGGRVQFTCFLHGIGAYGYKPEGIFKFECFIGNQG